MRAYDLPLIAPEAIQAYLSRPCNDYSFLKAAQKEELRAHAHGLGYRYVTEPRINQLVCNIIAAQEPRWLYYADMGAGKSKERIDHIRFLKRAGQLQRALIAAPEFVHLDAWEEQLAEHGPDLRYVRLEGSKDERFEMIDKKADVYLINWAGLSVYMAEKKRKKEGGSKKGVSGDAAGLFASLFNWAYIDEIHRLRGHDSLIFRLFCWLAVGAPFFSAGTGTPLGRDPLMLWPQFKIVDDGETFGSLGMFKAAFFTAKKRYFGKRFGGYNFQFKEERTKDLSRLLRNRSIIYEEHELGDMPKKTQLRVNVQMTAEQRMFNARISEKMAEVRGDYRSLNNMFTRARQCASGFLSLKDDDESRVEVDMSPNPKLEAMRQVILDMPAGEKFLIFHHFYHSGWKLRKLLDELEIEWATLYGRARMEADGLRQEGQYHRFLERRQCRAFVLQCQAGSEAINPHKVCRYAWFYERPDDPLISHQAEKRVYRLGQPWHCIIGDLVVLGTVEGKLLKYVKESRDMRQAVLRGEERPWAQ